MNKNDITIVVCCAGMGTRLGTGSTKALVKIDGKPLIIHQLEMLDKYSDIRVVVGFQAEQVIDVVRKYRKDVMFVFNYDYHNTGPGVSLSKAIVGADKYTVSIDGDVLIQKEDLLNLIDSDFECVGGAPACSDETLYLDVKGDKVIGYTNEKQEFEACGIVKVETKNILNKKEDRIIDMIQSLLPLKFIELNAREVDTPDDYERMIAWYNNLKK